MTGMEVEMLCSVIKPDTHNPIKSVTDCLDITWETLCQYYDVQDSPMEISEIFEDANFSCSEGVAITVITNMLIEITQRVHRFSCWYKAPSRAFGLISMRNPQTNRCFWGLAPEALHQWREFINQLTEEIEAKSGLLHAMLIIDNLGGQDHSPSQRKMATCQCDPPKKIWVQSKYLRDNVIVCDYCNQTFQF